MGLEGIDAAGVRRWRCDRCGKVDAWGPTWWWFGALKDDCPEGVFCSDRCKETSGLVGEELDAKPKRKAAR